MKNQNILWGIKRIQGELLKLGISLDKKTISSILGDFRRKGRINTGQSWRTFIQTHAQSLFACFATSVKAPNMNAYAERFVRSVRKEALDRFIIVSEKQLRFILERYVLYYNSLRPHQGIDQRVPDGYSPQAIGDVVSHSVLGGLHHHYTRKTA